MYRVKEAEQKVVYSWWNEDLHMASRQCATLPGVRERQDRGRIESAGNSLFTLLLAQEPLR